MMEPLPIDFAPQSPARSLVRIGLPAWACLTLGAILFLPAALQSMRCVGALRQQAAQLQTLKRQADEQRIVAPQAKSAPVPVAQATGVNRAVSQLNLPWRDLLDALEAASGPSLAMLALEVDASAQRVKGMAEATDITEMLAYMHRLKRQDLLKSAVLTRHEINEREQFKPVRFQFEVRWEPAS
jgi:Tfp pilus assembly protein PilN